MAFETITSHFDGENDEFNKELRQIGENENKKAQNTGEMFSYGGRMKDSRKKISDIISNHPDLMLGK